MTRAFTTQYAKDALMDNSRIIFGTDGNPTGWTDTAGQAHPLPVDFQRVSAATCEQYRAWALENARKTVAAIKDGVMTWAEAVDHFADEQTLEHIRVRPSLAIVAGNGTMAHGTARVISPDARQFYRDQNARDDKADRRWYIVAGIAAVLASWAVIAWAVWAVVK